MIDVLDKTKLIDGVTCLVVQDRVSKNGELVEDTDDWFAQAKNGESSTAARRSKTSRASTATIPGVRELVSIDGSFKQGRDGDKGGIYFQGVSTVGQVYRQEFSPGNAEDAVEVLSTTYGFGSDPQLDQFVPRGLAESCRPGTAWSTGEFCANPSRARWLRAQVLRARDRCLPRNSSGHGDIVRLVGFATSIGGVPPCLRREAHRCRRACHRKGSNGQPGPAPGESLRAGRFCQAPGCLPPRRELHIRRFAVFGDPNHVHRVEHAGLQENQPDHEGLEVMRHPGLAPCVGNQFTEQRDKP